MNADRLPEVVFGVFFIALSAVFVLGRRLCASVMIANLQDSLRNRKQSAILIMVGGIFAGLIGLGFSAEMIDFLIKRPKMIAAVYACIGIVFGVVGLLKIADVLFGRGY